MFLNKFLQLLVAIIILVQNCLAVFQSQYGDYSISSSWPGYSTMRSDQFSTGPEEFVVVRQSAYLQLRSAPAIELNSGKPSSIYVASEDGYLYELEAEHLKEVHRIYLGGVVSSPSLSSKNGIFVTNSEGLIKLSYADLSVLGRFSSKTDSHSHPVMGMNGGVFFASEKVLYHIDGETMEMLWTFESGKSFHFSSLLIDQNGDALISFSDTVVKINGNSGLKVWQSTKNSQVDSTAVSRSGDVICWGTDSPNIFQLDSKTGEEMWNDELKIDGAYYLVVDQYGDLIISSYGRIYKYSGKTRTRLWEFVSGKTSSSPFFSIVIDKDGCVLATSTNSGKQYKINGATGQLVWETDLDFYGNSYGQGIDFDGSVFVAKGKLYKLSPPCAAFGTHFWSPQTSSCEPRCTRDGQWFPEAAYFLDIYRNVTTPLPQCLKCPDTTWGTADETATTCTCYRGIFDVRTNTCIPCPSGSFAAQNTCHCDNGVYLVETNTCQFCPRKSSLNLARDSCLCENGVYSSERNECRFCPKQSTLNPPRDSCICEELFHDWNGVLYVGGEYDEVSNTCEYCPSFAYNSTKRTCCKYSSLSSRIVYGSSTESGCTWCPGDSVQVISNELQCQCENGFYIKEDNGCRTCPQYSTAREDLHGYCSCWDGYYDFDRNECLLCDQEYSLMFCHLRSIIDLYSGDEDALFLGIMVSLCTPYILIAIGIRCLQRVSSVKLLDGLLLLLGFASDVGYLLRSEFYNSTVKSVCALFLILPAASFFHWTFAYPCRNAETGSLRKVIVITLLWSVLGLLAFTSKILIFGAIQRLILMRRRSDAASLDESTLDYIFFNQLFLETLPQLVIQVINNSLLELWSFDFQIIPFILSVSVVIRSLMMFYYRPKSLLASCNGLSQSERDPACGEKKVQLVVSDSGQ